MEILLNQRQTAVEPCPYIDSLESSNSYFLARNVSAAELNELLEKGWIDMQSDP